MSDSTPRRAALLSSVEPRTRAARIRGSSECGRTDAAPLFDGVADLDPGPDEVDDAVRVLARLPAPPEDSPWLEILARRARSEAVREAAFRRLREIAEDS